MGDEEPETGASQSSDSHDATEKTCEYCGAAIETSDWYPVTNERGADGSVRLYDFCSEDCQDAWLDERSD